MERDAEKMAGDVLPVGGTPCQGGGRHARHKEQKEKISKKPGAAERSHHVHVLPVTSPRNWGDPRLTHNKSQGKFVLQAEGRQEFPLGACKVLWCEVFLPSIQVSCQNVMLSGSKL